MTSETLIPLPALIADVGGTNARFAIVDRNGRLGEPIRVLISDHATMASAIRSVVAGLYEPPASAIFALAGVVHGDRAPLTNAPWVCEPLELIAAEGMSDVIIMNDFTAVSLSLPALDPQDEIVIGGGSMVSGGTRLAIGPGTGLGASALLRTEQGWVATGGEGGHMDFGPRTEADHALWPHLEKIGGRVSAEWIISGPGLLRLHRALAASRGVHAPVSTPSQVARAGLSGTDPLAAETLQLFTTYLGRYAGDLALMFLPPGGVHIAGGIAPTLIEVMRTGGFREAFVDKAPHRDVMERIATAVITHPSPALVGLAAFLVSPQSYSVDLSGRHWRG